MTANVRWLNPFIVSAFEVLRSFGMTPDRSGELAIEEDYCTTDPLTVIIPVTGSLEGTVLYGMETRTARSVAGAMMGVGRQVRVEDALIQSALGELGNMVTGRASALLEQEGKACTIAPPIVAMDARLIVSSEPFERLVVPVETGLGQMRIHLALREPVGPDKEAHPHGTDPGR